MRNDGVSNAAGNIDKHVHGWTGKVHRTGSVRDMTKDSTPYCDSSKAQARLPSPGLLPPRMGFLPRMAAVAPTLLGLLPRMAAVAPALLDLLPRMAAAAPQVAAVPPNPGISSSHVRSPRWKLKSNNSKKGMQAWRTLFKDSIPNSPRSLSNNSKKGTQT